jgi:TrmH family RNA methyltransferase
MEVVSGLSPGERRSPGRSAMEQITSLHNPRVRAWAKLGERKERLAQGCFLVEGLRLVTEALRSGAPVRQLLADGTGMPHLEQLLSLYPAVEALSVPSEVLARLLDTRTPQGLAAVVDLPAAAQQASDGRILFQGGGMPEPSRRRVLCLERVQDPGNVGTMLRSADACGFDSVILSTDSADPWQPKVVRASMGSLWHLGIHLSDSLTRMVAMASEAGLRTFAADPRDALPAWRADLREGFLLVIGNEANGLSDHMRQAVSQTVMIPMQGHAESLNAAAAASMLLYESLRQRQA